MLRYPFLAAVFTAVMISHPAVFPAQQPSPPPPPPPSPSPSPAPAPAPSEESSSKHSPAQAKASHADDFLLRGTVFTPEGMAMPGVELRIRRTTDKKSKWDAVSNSRGEFAVRVKMGSDYEVTIHVKGYQPLSETVDAKTGERYKELVFRMQRQEGKKS